MGYPDQLQFGAMWGPMCKRVADRSWWYVLSSLSATIIINTKWTRVSIVDDGNSLIHLVIRLRDGRIFLHSSIEFRLQDEAETLFANRPCSKHLRLGARDVIGRPFETCSPRCQLLVVCWGVAFLAHEPLVCTCSVDGSGAPDEKTLISKELHGDDVKTISNREGIPISHTKQQIAETFPLLWMPRAAIIQDGLMFAATQGPCVLWTLLQNVVPPSGSESEIPE